MGWKFLDAECLWSPLPERPSSPNTVPSLGPRRAWCVCKLWFENLPQISWEPLCWEHSPPLRSCSLAWCKAWSVCRSRRALQACGWTESSAGCPPPRKCRRLLLRTSRLRWHGARRRSGRLEWSSSRADHGLPSCPGPQWGSLGPPRSSWTPPRCSGDSRWPWHGELCSAGCTAQSSPNREHAPSGTTGRPPGCLHLGGTKQTVQYNVTWCEGKLLYVELKQECHTWQRLLHIQSVYSTFFLCFVPFSAPATWITTNNTIHNLCF